jgi:hypothetical protein
MHLGDINVQKHSGMMYTTKVEEFFQARDNDNMSTRSPC